MSVSFACSTNRTLPVSRTLPSGKRVTVYLSGGEDLPTVRPIDREAWDRRHYSENRAEARAEFLARARAEGCKV